MFELADRGHRTVFEQLVACVISIRTRDEAMLPTALALFARAPTPATSRALTEAEIDALIARGDLPRGEGAHDPRDRARARPRSSAATLPCDFDVLTSFHGVGPKCANLALGIACGQRAASASTCTCTASRTGGASSRRATPEQTMVALEAILPKRYWIEINRLLVPFGKHVCTGVRPKCSTCPVLDMCRQVGVTSHR